MERLFYNDLDMLLERVLDLFYIFVICCLYFVLIKKADLLAYDVVSAANCCYICVLHWLQNIIFISYKNLCNITGIICFFFLLIVFAPFLVCCQLTW